MPELIQDFDAKRAMVPDPSGDRRAAAGEAGRRGGELVPLTSATAIT